MQGLRVPSFFPTKKNPAPAGGRRRANDTRCLRLGEVLLHGLPLWAGQGEDVSSRRGYSRLELDCTVVRMVQWEGRWCGSCGTASPRSWYSLGTFARSRGSSLRGVTTGACAFCKHRLEHDGSHSRISCRLQSTRGRCLAIHGCPSTTGECGVSIISREISSWWFPESFMVTGTIAWEMRPSRCPLKERATSGLETSTRGTPHWAATVASRKLSSAPESRRADVFLAPSWATPGSRAGRCVGDWRHPGCRRPLVKRGPLVGVYTLDASNRRRMDACRLMNTSWRSGPPHRS